MISVIIATKNGGGFLKKAVESVQKQTFSDLEILIISDGSTDNTVTLAKELAAADARIRVIENQENRGPGAARDQGIKESKGVYVAFIDDDDVWISTEKLSLQKKYLDEHPNIDVVGASRIEFVKEKNNGGTELLFVRQNETDPEKIWRNMLSYNPLVNSSVLLRKEAYIKAGGFKPMYLAEDYDLWLRMGVSKNISNIDGADIRYLVRQGGVSVGSVSISRNAEMAKVVLRLIREHKNNYPRFAKALIKGYARLVAVLLKNIFKGIR